MKGTAPEITVASNPTRKPPSATVDETPSTLNPESLPDAFGPPGRISRVTPCYGWCAANTRTPRREDPQGTEFCDSYPSHLQTSLTPAFCATGFRHAACAARVMSSVRRQLLTINL